MKWIKFFIIICLMFIIVFGISNSAMVTQYISSLKSKQIMTTLPEWDKYINNYANEHDQQAIEPRVDKIWGLIPGYNGLIVDREGTLQLVNKQKPISEEEVLFIWEEVKPSIDLRELGPYPVYRGNPEKPTVSLMFNVAWGTEYLDVILNILNEYHVKSTFFVDGSWLKENTDMAKRIVDEGHEIGNHAYSHPQMSKLTDERIRGEIARTEELINEITGQSSSYFAPPSGDYNQRVVEIAYELNLTTVLWTLDTIDWQKPTKTVILNRIIPEVENGNLILLHPTKSSVDALPELITEIEKKGLKITTVKETLSPDRILHVESFDNF